MGQHATIRTLKMAERLHNSRLGQTFGNSHKPDVSTHTCDGIAAPGPVLFDRGRKHCQYQIQQSEYPSHLGSDHKVGGRELPALALGTSAEHTGRSSGRADKTWCGSRASIRSPVSPPVLGPLIYRCLTGYNSCFLSTPCNGPPGPFHFAW